MQTHNQHTRTHNAMHVHSNLSYSAHSDWCCLRSRVSSSCGNERAKGYVKRGLSSRLEGNRVHKTSPNLSSLCLHASPSSRIYPQCPLKVTCKVLILASVWRLSNCFVLLLPLLLGPLSNSSCDQHQERSLPLPPTPPLALIHPSPQP